MIDSYWDLYVAYIAKCVRDNWANDVDPHHYEMEWNHFLPQCIFGDWPIGHYLTLKQHAIASALQTLAFKKQCMCGWHKKYLPGLLLELAWPMYCETTVKTGAHRRSPGQWSEDSRKGGEIGGRKTQTLGVGIFEPGMSQVWGRRAAEMGAGFYKRSPEQKIQDKVKAGKSTTAQVWESTVDGFRSNPGAVAQHNKARGWDPDARVRVR